MVAEGSVGVAHSTQNEPSILDRVETRLLEIGGELREKGGSHVVAPVAHRFTPGLYIREIFMPAGALITSAVHKTEHPYVVSAGRCLVYLENEHRWQVLQAPHTGITKPGTRRFLIIVYDTIWTTFHVTSKTEVADIEAEILEPSTNPLLQDAIRERLAADAVRERISA